jgi:hypothetical protein
MTVEEYFQLEANGPDTRYEYFDVHACAMAGGTANHDTIKYAENPAVAYIDGEFEESTGNINL